MSVSTDSRIRDDLESILNQQKYTDVIDALRPNSILTVDISDKDFIDIYCENQDVFFKLFREAVYRQLEAKLGRKMDVRSAFAGLQIKPIGTPAVLMQELKPREHENHILTFDCQVIAVDERKSYIKKGSVVCGLCDFS